MSVPSVPTPERVSQWSSMRKIIYSCPKCNTVFSFYGDLEKFCHNCGTEIDWSRVPQFCSEEFSEKYHSCDDFHEQYGLLCAYVFKHLS